MNDLSTRSFGRTGLVVLALAIRAAAAGQQPPPSPPPPDAPVLTLDDAVAQALANNRSVASARLDVDRAGERLGSAKSYRWPTLSAKVLESRLLTSIDFHFDEGAFGTYPGTGPIPSKNTTISTPQGFATIAVGQLTFPVSQQYKIGLGVRMSESDVEYYREALLSARQKAVLDVRKAYYGVLEAESALAAAQQTSAAAAEVERVVGEKFRAQSALEVDVTEARAQKASAEASLLSASNSVLSQKEQLNLLMARDVRTEFRAVSVADPLPVSVDIATARAKALAQTPGARQARLTAAQAELQWKKKKSEYIPDLSFSASYLSPFSIKFLPKNIFAVGLLLDWEVFDGGRRARDAAEAREQAEQARLAAADRDASVEVDVAKKYRSLEESRRKLAAADLLRAARRDRLRISGDRYAQQAIRAEDLLRSQADLAEAEKQYVAALAGYWSARADYDRAVGEDPS